MGSVSTMDDESGDASTPTSSATTMITNYHLQTPFSMDASVRELAILNVRLWEHSRKLPPISTVPTGRTPSANGTTFPIDDTFNMTQSLIDIIKNLYPPTPSTIEEMFMSPPPPPQQTPAAEPDQGTLLLIMSCTTRVFDIYDLILGHMRGCIQHGITPVTPETGETIVLPQVRLGTFEAPAPSSVAMHMLLVVLTASELSSQLQEVLRCWRYHNSSSSGGGGTSGSSPGVSGGGGSGDGPEFTIDIGTRIARRAQAVATEICRNRNMLLTVISGGRIT